MSVKLSRRQQEVLSKLLDLYHEGGKPIHYAALAKHLGVGPVSAYETLRLLEEHGKEFGIPTPSAWAPNC